MNVLVTGGAGYIGSHTAVALLDAGHAVTLLDNFANSQRAAVDAIRAVANRPVDVVEGDVCDSALLDATFAGARARAGHGFDAVLHFAALKAAGESVVKPLAYYRNNVGGTSALLAAMAAHDVRAIVFSSSATVYGTPAKMPITEDLATVPINPYGRTKLIGETLLRDVRRADPTWRVSVLRYFNPIGGHPSGELGEDPRGAPENLLPYVAQVAVGRRPHLNVFGDDYDTPDGTCIRDYVHVCDLAAAHVRALACVGAGPGFFVHNIGTGRGYSVLEVVRAFEAASGRRVPLHIAPRRPGDAPVCYADPSRARTDLGWQAEHDLRRMCEDAWRWQRSHPEGFGHGGG